MTHFIDIQHHSAAWLGHVLDVSRQLRRQLREAGANDPILASKTLAMYFEKPSLRTRVSFEQAMYQLGGRAITLGQQEVGLGKRETAADVARVLGGMVDAITARVFKHQTLIDLAEHAGVPVVNGLSEASHPCQALADAMTMQDEFGDDLAGRTVGFVGDGNNVARSLAWLCAKLGVGFVLAAPPGFTLAEEELEHMRAATDGAGLRVTDDPADAVRHADVVYTDTAVSMGQETEAESRLKAFAPYQVNEALLAHAPPHAIVMHCLPAYRGVEITDGVLDGPRSRVFPQAHNRLHAQKGLLAVLLGSR